MKILIVEDDAKTANYLKKGLEEQLFSVDICHDGLTAMQFALERKYDLYIFDIMLPKMSGTDLLKKLRTSGDKTYSIFLTAKDQVVDRVDGLNSGADAYLVKPFSFSELLAIIRSLQRRLIERDQGAKNTASSLQLDNLKIDFVNQTVELGGKLVDLTPTEFRLLGYLVRHCGEVVSRTLILEQVWDINFDCGTNVVDVHVRRLRAKLGDTSSSPIIHTVRGVGYMVKKNA